MKKQFSVILMAFLFVITSCHTGRISLTPALKKQTEVSSSTLHSEKNNVPHFEETETHYLETVIETEQEQSNINEKAEDEVMVQNELIEVSEKVSIQCETKLNTHNVENEKVQAADSHTRSGKSVWLIFLIAILLALLGWIFFAYLGIFGMIMATIFWIAAVIYLIIGIVTLIF